MPEGTSAHVSINGVQSVLGTETLSWMPKSRCPADQNSAGYQAEASRFIGALRIKTPSMVPVQMLIGCEELISRLGGGFLANDRLIPILLRNKPQVSGKYLNTN